MSKHDEWGATEAGLLQLFVQQMLGFTPPKFNIDTQNDGLEVVLIWVVYPFWCSYPAKVQGKDAMRKYPYSCVDGLENVSPASNMAILGIYVKISRG